MLYSCGAIETVFETECKPINGM